MFGLFLMSALDSSFLVLPFGNDLLLIALVSSNREGWCGLFTYLFPRSDRWSASL